MDDGHLQQVTGYATCGGGVGRVFETDAGIIGKAFNENRVVTGTKLSGNHEDFIEELVEYWNYTEENARKLDPSTESWMAVPIAVSGKVEFVVYCDATVGGFFDDTRKKLVVSASSAIWSFIS